MVRVGWVMVAGVEVVVIGVNREGGQKRGEIGGGREEVGRTTGGLEVKKMIGRVRADEDGEIEVREGVEMPKAVSFQFISGDIPGGT